MRETAKSTDSVRELDLDARGATQIEHLILVITVAIGFAAAAVPLGALLLGYHDGIEFVLALPVP